MTATSPPEHLDDGIERFLAAVPPEPDARLDVAERRLFMRRASDRLHEQFGEPGAEVAEIHQVAVPARRGTVRVRAFLPRDRRPGEAHVLLHGGGWWHGSPDELVVETACRERAAALRATVLAVDYGLAPERRFPCGLDDVADVWTWLWRHGDEWDVDVARTSVGGASAGANLAAALCLLVRDQGMTMPLFQLLEVPALDLTGAHSLSTAIPDRFGLGSGLLLGAIQGYLRSPQDADHPYASPLRAPDLSGLPDTHVMVAEWDPVRPDGELYARRLSAAGVRASCSISAGGIHGSAVLTRTWPGARAWQAEVLRVLTAAHGVDGADEAGEQVG